MMTEEPRNAYERLTAALAAATLPASVRAAIDAPPADPVPGQIWRAAWGQVVELVLIRSVDEAAAVMVPVSFDVGYADDATFVLARDATSLSAAVAVWVGLQRLVPIHVLDRVVGQTDIDVTMDGWAEAAAASGLATLGRHIRSDADPLNEFRAGIDDAMDELSAATWVSGGTGELAGLIASSGIQMEALTALLNTAPQRALAIRRGQAAATQDEAERLAPSLGVRAADVLTANPPLPVELRMALSRPRRRAQVQQFAKARQLPETEAWLAAGYGAFALAARQTGELPGPAWEERLDAYFASVLGGQR